MLAAPAEEFDPTLPGLFAGDPPAEFVPLLEEMAAAVRPESIGTQLFVMAEADQRDLLPRIAVPTLLIWGELDARSPLSVAHQFEQAIPDTKLVVIPSCGHVSNLEQPEQFNEAVREFCRSEAVIEAAGLDRFALLGVSQGAAIALTYAVRHPERLTGLVLYGGYARGRMRRGPEERRTRDALISAILGGLGGAGPHVPPRVQHALPSAGHR